MAEAPSITFDDLSGGMTDNLLNSLPTQGEIVENFYITEDQKLRMRGGSEILDANLAANLPRSRVNTILNFGEDAALLINIGEDIYTKPTVNWTALVGPQSNPALQSAPLGVVLVPTVNMTICADELNGHMYLVAQDLSQATPVLQQVTKVFQHTDGTFRVRNAGMPKYPSDIAAGNRAAALAQAITLANELRSDTTTHMADTATPSGGVTGTHAFASSFSYAAVATDEDSLCDLAATLISAYVAHVEQDAALANGTSASIIHFGATAVFGNFRLPRRKIPTTLEECIPVLVDLKRHWHFHFDAYFEDTARRQHGSTYTALATPITSSSDFESNPDFADGNWDTYVQPRLDVLMSTLSDHLADTVTAEGHQVAGSEPDTYISTAHDHTTIMRGYHFVHAYIVHRVDNTAHLSSEAAGTAITFTLDRDNAHDFTSGPSKQDFTDKIMDAVGKYNTHRISGTRHKAVGGLLGHGIVFPTAVTIGQFVYAFLFHNKYQTFGSITFEDRGTPYLRGVVAVTSLTQDNLVSTFSVSITNIEQANAWNADENWPDTMGVEIYRTIDAETILYSLGETAPSATTYTDRTDDESLQNSTPIYTTAGVYANDPPPRSMAFSIVNRTAYYGGVVESVAGVETLNKKRLRQSIPEDPDSCPESFFKDTPTDIITIGGAVDRPIVVCKRGVYRVDGQISELGDGEMILAELSSTVGGASPTGGATLEDTFFFAGADGFYMTDGYKVQKISQHLNASYASIVATDLQKHSIQARTDTKNRRVLWTATTQANVSEGEVLWVLDMQHGLNPDGTGRFSRLSGPLGFSSTALEFYNGDLIRGTRTGYVFSHDEDLTSDPKVSTLTGLLTGDIQYIPWRWRSIATDFGDKDNKKWTNRAEFEFSNHGNLSVQPGCIEDLDSADLGVMTPIRFREEYDGIINESRTFPAGSLRCIYKQIEVKPGTVFIISSDDSSPVTLVSVAGSLATLATSAYDWPADCEEWYISFASDNYVVQHLITNRVSGDTLQLGTSPAGVVGSVKWQLKGIPKDEIAHLLSVSMFYKPISNKQTPSSGVTGANS